jgi:DNA-directed RNA polymerase subunit N
MMIPVRCFSCGQVVADRWEEFDMRVNKNKEDPEKVLGELKVSRYCCRRMLISHVDLIDEIINFSMK